MAHFAEIDSNNIVIRVIVIDNSDTLDAQGNESESIGSQFCTDLFGGEWIKTSYNDTIRNKYALMTKLWMFLSYQSLMFLGHITIQPLIGKLLLHDQR